MKIFCISIAVGFVIVLGTLSSQNLENFRAQNNLSLINGEYTQSLEAYYNDHFPVKNFGTYIWTALRYQLLNEGKTGVVIGSDGWLFTNEEFVSYPDVDSRLQARFQQIEQIARFVRRHDSELVLVLVPAKARIYTEKLTGRQPADFHRELYTNAVEQLTARKIHALDLRPALADHSPQPTFIKTDTHWTPLGARRSANIVAQYISENHLLRQPPTTKFVTELVDKKIHRGDLLNFIPLGPFADWLGPEPETLPVYETYNSAAVDTNTLFADVDADIALVGSSYSANPLWNFAGALKQFLSRDLVNYAEEGKGPMLPLMMYLGSSDFTDNPPALVIWEFPERYLPVEYDLSGYAHVLDQNESLYQDESRKVADSL